MRKLLEFARESGVFYLPTQPSTLGKIKHIRGSAIGPECGLCEASAAAI